MPLGDLSAVYRTEDPTEVAWQLDAACRGAGVDPEVFFPEGRGKTYRPARTVCLDCPVADECLEYALVHDERFGVWGGLSEQERRRLVTRRTS